MTQLLEQYHNAASEINRLHNEICDATRTTIEKAIQIGELLTLKKADLNHGTWLPWLRENIVFNLRTAQRYMLIASRKSELKNDSVSYLTDAYKLLSETKPLPDEEICSLYAGTRLDRIDKILDQLGTGDISMEDAHRATAPLSPLTKEEAAHISERISKTMFETLPNCGRALVEIRDRKLFRDQAPTFSEYCRKRSFPHEWVQIAIDYHEAIEAARIANNPDILVEIFNNNILRRIIDVITRATTG